MSIWVPVIVFAAFIAGGGASYYVWESIRSYVAKGG